MEREIKVGDYVKVINSSGLLVGDKGGVYEVVTVTNESFVINVAGVHQYIAQKNVKLVGKKLKVIFDKNNTIVQLGDKKAVSYCDKSEMFDKEKGVAMALCKLFGISYNDIRIAIAEENNEIKVGDIVTVQNTGACYETYANFFAENNIKGLKMFYQEQKVPKIGMAYEVCAIGKHNFFDRKVYAIRDYKNRVFLMDGKGLQKVED